MKTQKHSQANPARRGDSAAGVLILIVLVILIAVGGACGGPIWNKWRAEVSGEAQLAEAESTRKIQIEEARATMESSKLLAQAEVERAKGVAEANRIIAEGLGGPEGYLRWLWIQGLDNASGQVIYIPTEAGLPILEASRLQEAAGH